MFDESPPRSFASVERDDREAEAILEEQVARLRREKKRPFIAAFERVATRASRTCVAPSDFASLILDVLRTEPSLVKESLLELDALRVRLAPDDIWRLAESQENAPHGDVPAARTALTIAGFPTHELTDEAVRQILDYLPLLQVLRSAAPEEPL